MIIKDYQQTRWFQDNMLLKMSILRLTDCHQEVIEVIKEKEDQQKMYLIISQIKLLFKKLNLQDRR